MGNFKKKSDGDPLFLDFLNSRITIKLIDRIFDHIKFDKKSCDVSTIKSEFNQKIKFIRKFHSCDKAFFNDLLFNVTKRESIGLDSSDTNTSLINQKEREMIKKIIGKMQPNEDCDILLKRFYPAFYLVSEIMKTRGELRHNLIAIIRDKYSNEKFLDWINVEYNWIIRVEGMKTHFSFDNDAYIKRETTFKIDTVNEYGDPDVLRFYEDVMRPIVLRDFFEFLCTPDWQKLKQCKECANFFVTKTFKKEARFCCVKCRRDNNNRRRRESGQNTEDIRKWRAKNPNLY